MADWWDPSSWKLSNVPKMAARLGNDILDVPRGLIGRGPLDISGHGGREPGSSSSDPTALEIINNYLNTVSGPQGKISATPDQILSYLNTRSASGKDYTKASQKDLTTALNALSSEMGWQPSLGGSGALGGSQGGFPYDALSFQTLYQQAVLPYLQSIMQDEKGTANQLRTMALPSNLPSGYRDILTASNQKEAADMDRLMESTQQAGLQSPLNNLILQLAQSAQKTALQNYARTITQGAQQQAGSAATPIP